MKSFSRHQFIHKSGNLRFMILFDINTKTNICLSHSKKCISPFHSRWLLFRIPSNQCKKNQIFVQNKYWLYSTVCVVVCLCVSARICECIIMYEIIILSSLQIQHHSSQDITRNYFDIMKKPSKQWMHSTCSAILKDNYTSVAVWKVFCVRKIFKTCPIILSVVFRVSYSSSLFFGNCIESCLLI